MNARAARYNPIDESNSDPRPVGKLAGASMLRRLLYCASVISSLALAGCQEESLEAPIDSMTLYSLEAKMMPGRSKRPKGETFHDVAVLGKTDVASEADRHAILKAIKKGIAQSDGKENKCFWPRHGVRLVQNGKWIDYVICFECLQLDEYIDNQHGHKPTTGEAAEVLDQHLERAGVPQESP